MNILLSGGGVKCAFQLGILKSIPNDKINSIYGVSFGCIVGYCKLLDQSEILIDFFNNLANIGITRSLSYGKLLDDIVKKIPIINNLADIIWILYSIFNNGFYDPDQGYDLLKKLDSHAFDKNHVHKLKCTVFNITMNKIEIINGDHPLIHKYLISACAHWALYKPQTIRRLTTECVCDDNCKCNKGEEFCNCLNDDHKNNVFVDAGFDQIYPTIDLKNEKKLILVTGKGIKKLTVGKNMIEYLLNVISYQIDKQSSLLLESESNENTLIITYSPPIEKPDDINTDKIKQMLNDGEQIYINKIDKYINNV